LAASSKCHAGDRLKRFACRGEATQPCGAFATSSNILGFYTAQLNRLPVKINEIRAQLRPIKDVVLLDSARPRFDEFT